MGINEVKAKAIVRNQANKLHGHVIPKVIHVVQIPVIPGMLRAFRDRWKLNGESKMAKHLALVVAILFIPAVEGG